MSVSPVSPASSPALTLVPVRGPGRGRRVYFRGRLDPQVDVIDWSFAMGGVWMDRTPRPFIRGQRDGEASLDSPRVISRDVVLQHAHRVDHRIGSEPVAVQIFALRKDGYLVEHMADCHRPTSVFQMFGDPPQTVIRVRIFANVENMVRLGWPEVLDGISRVRGRVIVILTHKDGTRTRNVFQGTSWTDKLWATATTPPVKDLPGNDGKAVMSAHWRWRKKNR